MFELIGNEYNNILSNSSDRSECFELLSSNTDIRKYDAIVVDEGQDFSIDMGLSIRYLLANERESNTPQTALQKRKEYVALTRARYYLYVLETQI